MDTSQQCAECLEAVTVAVNARPGTILCQRCAEQFYLACAGCGELLPQDQAAQRDGTLYCMTCLATPTSDDTAALSDAELSALVAEFIRLHAEEKHLKDRLEAIKEQLKRHAASQPRVANAVLLRAGEHTVKCGYAVRVSYNAEKLAAVEAILGTESFTVLFEREVKFSPVKEKLAAFLTEEDAAFAAARAALLAAAERKETATLTPVLPKRQAGTSARAQS